jgi:ribonuclease HI
MKVKDQENEEAPPSKRQKIAPPGKRQKIVAPSSTYSTITKVWFHMNFDGGARGNPGPAGAGAEVITRITRGDNKGVVKRSKTKVRKYLNIMTNNQAEYHGLLCGLEYMLQVLVGMKEEDPSVTLVVQGDSDLIIRQLKGEYQCKSDKLKPLYRRAKQLVREIKETAAGKELDVTYEHVYRNANGPADGKHLNGSILFDSLFFAHSTLIVLQALANQAMDAKRSWTTTDEEDGDAS